MKAADFAIRHPTVIGILLISLALFGILSFRGMNHELLANITTPEILVMTVYPGASPEIVEREVTKPLEDEFSLIEGIEKVSSNSNSGYSLIFITMDWGVDLDAKKNDIRDRINNASAELPENIDGNPRLFELGTSSLPVYTCLVESDLTDGELAGFLKDDIVPRISRIADVSAVYTRGVEAPAIRVRLEPENMETMDITALDVYAAVSRGQAGVPAGDVGIGADLIAFQSDGNYNSIGQIGRQPVGYTGEGLPVYLDDVADLYPGFMNPEFRASSDGQRTVALDVMKRPGGDTESVVRGVKAIQAEISAESSGVIRFDTVLDNAETIGITLSSVSRSALFGGVLAIVILLLFLHDLRASLIVSLAIPFTVFLTFILMRARGMTLNIMTLAGITVSVGMIVDASIVILENTLRHRRMGKGAVDAASVGAQEVGGAVLASTSTSLSVFLPILFVSGLAGAILKEVSWVLIFALSSSALTAIFIVPWLSSRILEGEARNGPSARFGKIFDRHFDRFADAYSHLLQVVLDHRNFVLILAAVLVFASAAVIGSLGGEMFSAPDMNELEVSVRLPAGYDLASAEKKMREIAAVVRAEVPEIETDLWYAGLADSATIVDSGNPTSGYGRVRLTRAAGRKRSVFEIVRHLNTLLPATVPDAEFTVKNGGLAKQMDYATDGAGFRVELSGSDWETVLEAAGSLQKLMEADPLVSGSKIGVRRDRELIALEVNREIAGRLGVDPVSAGMNLRILFAGEEAGTLDSSGLSRPIFIDSSLAGGRMPVGIMGRIRVRNIAGDTVPYSAFTKMERRSSTDSIPHRDRLPSLVVVGNLRENDLSGVRSRLVPKLEDAAFPPGISWRVIGAAEVMGDTFRELGRALGIAIFLVYAVMVIQFERFTQPFIIMGAVPFVLIGVALSLAVFNTRISMMTFFGVIALGGMVVNNAIVLVEFANQLRAEGFAIRKAVLEAARIRLKPILITTLTTLLGLIPLAFSLGEGSQIYAPLGQVIGGGLLTSTLITLALVPVLYEWVETRRSEKASSRRSGVGKGSRSAGGGTGGSVLPILILIGILGFFGPGLNSAVARDMGDTVPPWSLEEMTMMALGDDPELQAARADARSASAQLRGARAERGPVVDLELGASYLSDPLLSVTAGALGELPPALGGAALPSEDIDVWGKANDFRYDLSAVLEQPLFTWGKISSGIGIAEAGRAAASWNAASREQSIIAEVRIACESLVLIGRMLELTTRQRELGDRLSELTLKNYEEGFLLETEYRDTRNRLQQIFITASGLETLEKDILLGLELMTGLRGLEKSDLLLPGVDDGLDSYQLPAIDELLISAGERNPDLQALESMESMAECRLDLARGNAGIKPDLMFRTEFGYGGGFDRSPDNLDGSWHLTFGVGSTLFDSGRSLAGIRSAEAERSAAVARSEDGRRRLESFIRTSRHAMSLNRANIDYYVGLRDTDSARADEKRLSWEAGYGREEQWLLAELDGLTSELQRLREVLDFLRLDRQVRAAAGISY